MCCCCLDLREHACGVLDILLLFLASSVVGGFQVLPPRLDLLSPLSAHRRGRLLAPLLGFLYEAFEYVFDARSPHICQVVDHRLVVREAACVLAIHI